MVAVDSKKSGSPRVGIVGAGILGASLAYAFARRGVAVTVIDEAKPLTAQGATANTFGWLSNQAFFRAKDPVPDDAAHAYFDLHRAGLEMWRRWDADLGADLGVRWTGTVQWAYENDVEVDRLKSELERRLAWGSPSREVDEVELHELIPNARAPKVDFGFTTPDEGTVNPFTAVVKMLAEAKAVGARLITDSKVVEIFETPGGARTIVHAGGTLECDIVIVACGRRTPELASGVGIDVPLIESTGELVHLEAMDIMLDPLVLGPVVNVVQRHDGRVVLGRHFTGQPLTDVGSLDVNALVADAAVLFPKLTGARVEKVTKARRIVPSDALPIWGESPEVSGVFALAMNAAITLGPVMSEYVVDELLGEAPVDALDCYRNERFAVLN